MFIVLIQFELKSKTDYYYQPFAYKAFMPIMFCYEDIGVIAEIT